MCCKRKRNNFITFKNDSDPNPPPPPPFFIFYYFLLTAQHCMFYSLLITYTVYCLLPQCPRQMCVFFFRMDLIHHLTVPGAAVPHGCLGHRSAVLEDAGVALGITSQRYTGMWTVESSGGMTLRDRRMQTSLSYTTNEWSKH